MKSFDSHLDYVSHSHNRELVRYEVHTDTDIDRVWTKERQKDNENARFVNAAAVYRFTFYRYKN